MSEWIKRLAEKYSEVNEKKLTGNQHKLDMDKDGDIDGDDFKHMRNKKKANEEEEVVMNPKKDKKDSKETMAAEAKIDEISKDLAQRYYTKASKSQSDSMSRMIKNKKDSDAEKTFNKRHTGLDNAAKRLAKEEVEQIDEISMDLAKKVHSKRKDQVWTAAHNRRRAEADKLADKMAKSKAYIDKREEVEQVDEISKDKVGRYLKKAQISTADAGRDTMDDRKPIRDRGIHKIVNRRMGTADAVRKLTGKARVPATESTIPTVYSRILEERAKHYKGATKPEDWNEKEKNNKGAMDMKKDMAVDTSDKISNYDDLGHDDASKAGRVTKAAKTRPGDNAAGDKNVINPVKK